MISMKMYFRNDFERDFMRAYEQVQKECGKEALFMSQKIATFGIAKAETNEVEYTHSDR